MYECPGCGREFGRARQSHTCVPAVSFDAWFEGRPVEWRGIYEAVHSHLAGLGPVTAEAVGVGILFKRSATFCELRPRRDGLALSVSLSRKVELGRVSRYVKWGSRVAHFVPLRAASDVDEVVCGLLTEGYFSSKP